MHSRQDQKICIITRACLILTAKTFAAVGFMWKRKMWKLLEFKKHFAQDFLSSLAIIQK